MIQHTIGSAMERLGYTFPPSLLELHQQVSQCRGWKVEYFPVREHHGFVPGFGYTFSYFNANVALVFFNPELNEKSIQLAVIAHELTQNYLNTVQKFPDFRIQLKEEVERNTGIKLRTALKRLVEHPRIDAELKQRAIRQTELNKEYFELTFDYFTSPRRIPAKKSLDYRGLVLVAANLFYLASEKQRRRIMYCRKGIMPKIRSEARDCVRVMERHGNCLEPKSCFKAAREILSLLNLEPYLEIKTGFTPG